MIQHPFIYYHYFHSPEKYLFRIDQEITYNNIAREYPEVTQKMDYVTKNLYQISRYLENKNQIFPEEVILNELKKKWIKE
jgi:hypothetical protein